MDKKLHEISEHMRQLGLGALAHANWHANCGDCSHTRWWPELSVLQAAHAAEILIKARIAEEHPLLIFEQLPKSGPEERGVLSFEELVGKARTLQFSELPDRLWASTGKRLKNLQRYHSFGRLRNTIQHFAAPNNVDVSQETIEFIYEVVDPFINECWGLFAVDFNDEADPYAYLVAGLVERGIEFLVSPGVLVDIDQIELKWPSDNPAYKAKMGLRLKLEREQRTPLLETR